MTQQQLLINIYYFVLILARIIGLLVISPIFGSKAIPRKLKLSLALLIVFVLFSVIPLEGIQIPEKLLMIFFQIIIELFIGLIMGFIFLLTFTAIQLAGQFIDRRMGFALANVMDPQNGSQVPLVGQFKNILATLLFLEMEGHHYILKLLADSFDIVPITKFETSSDLVLALLRIVGDLFPLAFKIAVPMIAVLFMIDVAFGLVARTVPQLNVFIMGLPTKIIVGLVVLSFVLPNYVAFLDGLFTDTIEQVYQILKIMSIKG